MRQKEQCFNNYPRSFVPLTFSFFSVVCSCTSESFYLILKENSQIQKLCSYENKRCSQKFCKIHRKTRVRESHFNKVAGLRRATLLKKRLWYRCLPVSFTKFLRTPFFIDHLWWLLLWMIYELSRIFEIIPTGRLLAQNIKSQISHCQQILVQSQ